MKLPAIPVTRRNFLGSACAAPLVIRALQAPAAFAEPAVQHAPYLRLATYIQPGADEFPEEAQAMRAEAGLWHAVRSGTLPVANTFSGRSIVASHWRDMGLMGQVAAFSTQESGSDAGFGDWLNSLGTVRRAQFFVLPNDTVRFEVAATKDGRLLYATGHWRVQWQEDKIASLQPVDEARAIAREPLFRDVTGTVMANCSSFHEQLCKGVPYWRSRLDPATGIDIYGSNGIAVGDINADGVDEVYVCQPGGLPNRLFRFHDGVFEDISEQWGVALLDDTSAALFLDLRNSGKQDLVVLRSSGPLLYLNEGGRFRLRDDAFDFATRPQGGFTGLAAADYDRDGRLDLYLCTYVYFQSEAQYTYAVPYHDAQNGPPNFLFQNNLNADGSGAFHDVTAASGVNQNNNRFSFAPTWCDTNGDGWPDLYVANDFGRNNFYKNEGGRFRDAAAEAGIEDIAPGMSSSWFDYDNDGRPDLYVGNMWSPSGQRAVHSPKFLPARGGEFAEAYRRHTKGNSLYRNKGDGTFEETTPQMGVAMGRWAWSSVGHDLDNDGNPEMLIGCGMLSNRSEEDMMSFFWRQVVSRSPQQRKPAPAYENGWNAINQFIREDYSWNGHEPNVMYARQGDRYFDVSGISGLDFPDDTRAFAITDFDSDGRPDIILKNRLAPQIRVLQNNCAAHNHAIAFELQGTRSNRDAIGAKVQIVNGPAVWLSAESGYLSQHSKRVTIGLGPSTDSVHVRITWPSGLVQNLGPLEPGFVYRVVEGGEASSRKPFSPAKPIEEHAFTIDNEPRLEDTWFIEPLPLPEAISGPALLVLKGKDPVAFPNQVPVRTVDLSTAKASQKDAWRIFRRYLFDYRQDLKTPIAFLLDGNGRAAKVYASVPPAATVRADLAALSTETASRGLPFAGTHHKELRRDYFKFAAGFLWEGQTEAALPYLHETLRRGSDNPRIPMLIGQIYLRAGRVNEAEKYIRQALEWKPAYAEAWSELGGVYAARNDFRNALSCYEKALSISPGLTFVVLNAAQAAEKNGDVAKAREYYQHVMQMDPKNADAANGLGLLLAKQGQSEEAKKLFEQAIEERRDFGSAINNLAVLYLNTGKTNDAMAALEYGLQVAPDEDILYLNLGRVYAHQGQTERAREVMQRLLARKPGNAIAERALRELDNR